MGKPRHASPTRDGAGGEVKTLRRILLGWLRWETTEIEIVPIDSTLDEEEIDVRINALEARVQHLGRR